MNISLLSYTIPPHKQIKYNKMTTVDMLIISKNDYQKARNNIFKQLDDISKRYYKSVDIPPEVIKKITEMNKDVSKIEKIIDDINTAIKTIENEL